MTAGDAALSIAAVAAQPASGEALTVAVRALGHIAWGTTEDLKPIDPSVTADKALAMIRQLGVDLGAAEQRGTEQPAPEVATMPCEALAADNAKLRDALAVVLDLFAKGSDGWHARISQVNLARAYRIAQVPVPSELVKFL